QLHRALRARAAPGPSRLVRAGDPAPLVERGPPTDQRPAVQPAAALRSPRLADASLLQAAPPPGEPAAADRICGHGSARHGPAAVAAGDGPARGRAPRA